MRLPEFRVLREAHRLAEFGTFMGTSRQIPLHVVRRCVAAGWLKDAWMCVKVDGDLWPIQPEREQRCWAITDAGREAFRLAEEQAGVYDDQDGAA